MKSRGGRRGKTIHGEIQIPDRTRVVERRENGRASGQGIWHPSEHGQCLEERLPEKVRRGFSPGQHDYRVGTADRKAEATVGTEGVGDRAATCTARRRRCEKFLGTAEMSTDQEVALVEEA